MVPGQVFGGWRQLGQHRENDGPECGCSRKWQPGEDLPAVIACVAGTVAAWCGCNSHLDIPTRAAPREGEPHQGHRSVWGDVLLCLTKAGWGQSLQVLRPSTHTFLSASFRLHGILNNIEATKKTPLRTHRVK